MVPQYGPRLYIFPSLRYPGEFQFWSLQLLSLTLLEPQVAEPNHGAVYIGHCNRQAQEPAGDCKSKIAVQRPYMGA